MKKKKERKKAKIESNYKQRIKEEKKNQFIHSFISHRESSGN